MRLGENVTWLLGLGSRCPFGGPVLLPSKVKCQAQSRETWSVTSMRKDDWAGLDHAGQGGQVPRKRLDPNCASAP